MMVLKVVRVNVSIDVSGSVSGSGSVRSGELLKEGWNEVGRECGGAEQKCRRIALKWDGAG
jgi:hypothetical protein